MTRLAAFHPSWLTPSPAVTANDAAIDRLCLNLLTGASPLDGVAEERARTLRVEQALGEG